MTEPTDERPAEDLLDTEDVETGEPLTDDDVLTDDAAANQAAPGLDDADETRQTENEDVEGGGGVLEGAGWVGDESARADTES